jgi:hypothetical protein
LQPDKTLEDLASRPSTEDALRQLGLTFSSVPTDNAARQLGFDSSIGTTDHAVRQLSLTLSSVPTDNARQAGQSPSHPTSWVLGAVAW